ncbi:recombinase family protein [Streptomyces sp.]|uniref:recombinase family protein n=1 Tax=Streptomyces sp. TaxID=1931 RepID=UPI002D76CC6C|nr:recombinase family protein [Streptomyces sp.]HET6356583.1 recombinase family protein [Streptomyces sp.]
MTADDKDQQLRASSRRARRARQAAGTQRTRKHRSDWMGESAAIYCRISHVNDDDQTGVERQERICRDVAERLRLIADEDQVFVDNNRSAWQRKRKRPGWHALLAEASQGRIRHVLTYHPDRLMRQPRDLEELLQIADDHDITLHGQANRRDLADPDDRFFLRIEVAHACRSSDDTSRRLIDSMIDRAQDGRPHTGRRRYGDDKTGTRIIPEEAAIVREIFNRYLGGESPVQLAKELFARGVKTAEGRDWNAPRVRDLLDNRHVVGIRVFRGEEIGDGVWPAIIDRGMWMEVRERRAYRAAATATSERSSRFYLLRGVVTCTGCGKVMGGSGGTGARYVCNHTHRLDVPRCSRAVSAPILEEFVAEAAINLLERLDPTDAPTPSTLSEEERAAIEADRQELDDLKDMWESQELKTREYREMRRTVEARIAEIERKMIVRPTAEVLDGLVGPHARESWEELEDAENYQRMNAVIRFLFAAVKIKEATKKGRQFDYGRIDIGQNPIRV